MQKQVPIKPNAANQMAEAIRAVNEATANFQRVASLVLESLDIEEATITSVDTDALMLHLELPDIKARKEA